MNITQTSGPCTIKVSDNLDFLIVPRQYGETLPDHDEARKIAEAHANVVDFIQKVMNNRSEVWKLLSAKHNATENASTSEEPPNDAQGPPEQ